MSSHSHRIKPEIIEILRAHHVGERINPADTSSYNWQMHALCDLALKGLSGGPSERDAVLEECAKVCDDIDDNGEWGEAAAQCASAIRARKNAAPQVPATSADLGKADAMPQRSGPAELAPQSEAGAERGAAAIQALADIKWDVHNCDWRCEICTTDPLMAETDIAWTLRRFEEAHGTLPEPYSDERSATDSGVKG